MEPRTLLTPDQFDDVTATVAGNNPDMPADTARRVVEQALVFVATAARFRHAVIAPSRVVDEGWHALILHSKMYAALCNKLGGMVHHYPERPDPDRFDPQIIDRTCTLIEEAGYSVDRDLWTAPDRELVSVAADCQHSGGPNCGPIQPTPKPGAGPH